MINLTVVEDNVTITVSEVGPTGPAGQGVPVGGTAGQILAKINSTNYNTQWINNTDLTGLTSVGLSMPTGFTVANSPLIANGTLGVTLASGYVIPTQSALNAKVPYTGAISDVDLGAFDLKTSKLWLQDEVATGYGSIHLADNSMHFEDSEGHTMFDIEDGFIQIHQSNTIQSNLFVSNLTQTRDHYLPDASGTLALTSQIPTNPVGGTGTTNTLPKFTGASAIGDSNITDTGSLITLGSNSYVNGVLGIGTTSITGSRNLVIDKTLTGSTVGLGILILSTIASDVTTSATYFRSDATTEAASFTLPSLRHYFANQATFGAGSTVTTQVGYLASASLIGATNNYAFQGQIPSGTNRWNIYMDGTANNYMAGSLGIGTTSLTGYNLRLGANITGGTTAYGILVGGAIQSDVTNIAYLNRTTGSTAAASFTLAGLYHYTATTGTIGVGSAITTQAGFYVPSTTIGATNNYAFWGNLAAATNTWNLFMNGTAENYLAGNTGIGNSPNFISAGPILTTTLTNGGTGYVDGTYTDVAATNIVSNGVYALFTIVVSAGIVTTATLTWGGTTYRVGDTLTVSNTLLGGTGSGLIITVATVDSSVLTIASTTGGDITLYRNDTSSALDENIGTIKWESRDSSVKSSGIGAKIGAFSAGTVGGAYLSFSTRSVSAGTSLVEAMRIDSRGGVGIGATAINTYSLRVSKDITGATTSYGIRSDGAIQSDVTTSGYYFRTAAASAAASFTLAGLYHYSAATSGFGAGSTISNQYGFQVDSTMTGATNNYGFLGALAAATNTWNLYMNGTAANYMAGQVVIGTTSLNTSAKVQISSTTQGFLPPVMTTTQKNAIATPATGLVVFDTTLGKLCVFATTWQTITSA